ncbi:MAG TPA: DUF3536 domain-containing protein [Planctomycetota bacterium]|nr:DUF3536 domain-containing protein [Planctomycetota bacterium]
MTRYLCVHGHFYQPPRENPWLEDIEVQETAAPYHDWNERITAECYAQNAASRILGDQDRIVQIVNTYARISFNFGPTLLSWLERHDPSTYAAILAADVESRERFSGHGSAIAQAYNHVIMPLANERDRRTQVRWGIADFERRFGRKPEGMWLPETAVDDASLETLAECGITFTILSPHQARSFRALGAKEWTDAGTGTVDPTRCYRYSLPSGKSIVLFFYDGPVSRAVAFEGLLHGGDRFANRLASGFSDARDWPQLMHIATDGESYGHHHRYGDMALSWALDWIEANKVAQLTNYGEFLERHPPLHEVQIHQKSAWSCAHGVGRWERDCGCNSGSKQGWHQAWRAPLREALDHLRDRLAERFEKEAAPLLRDPWQARDAYIDVMLDRSPANVATFFERHAREHLADARRVRCLELLEMQRHAQLMYTSCGWFFDDISGIETVQIIQYAGRALQLARWEGESSPRQRFCELLAKAKSNVKPHRDGRAIFDKWVEPMALDLPRVATHYAVRSLFEESEDESEVYCFTITREDHQLQRSGPLRLVAGRAKVTSKITGEALPIEYAGVCFGDHNVTAGVRTRGDEKAFVAMRDELLATFGRADLPEVVRVLDRHLPGGTRSLRSLFRDDQQRILSHIVEQNVSAAHAAYRQVYQANVGLMRFLAEPRIHVPQALQIAADITVGVELEHALGEDQLDVQQIGTLLAEAEGSNVRLDEAKLGFTLRGSLERLAARLRESAEQLEQLEAAVEVVAKLPFEVDLSVLQNELYRLLSAGPADGAELAAETRARLRSAAESLGLWVA